MLYGSAGTPLLMMMQILAQVDIYIYSVKQFGSLKHIASGDKSEMPLVGCLFLMDNLN